MRLELELQYADFHPDQVEKAGLLDFEEAINVLQKFPWEREFAKIKERTRQNLTSCIPNLLLRNKDEELIISARDTDAFIVEFQDKTHHSHQIIPHNRLENKSGLLIEDIIARFYNGTIKQILDLKESLRHEIDHHQVYKLKDSAIYIPGTITAILAFILVIDFWYYGFTEEALTTIYLIGAFILLSGFSTVLTLQYLFTDWGKELIVDPTGLTIKQKQQAVKINKSDLAEVTIVENDTHRTLRYYKYARLKTKDGRTFIVTSFIIDPIKLVHKLKVHHAEEWVYIPLIRLKIISEKEKARVRKDFEEKKNEFLEIYKDLEERKLKEIVGDKKGYADYARDAAEEILNKRGKGKNSMI